MKRYSMRASPIALCAVAIDSKVLTELHARPPMRSVAARTSAAPSGRGSSSECGCINDNGAAFSTNAAPRVLCVKVIAAMSSADATRVRRRDRCMRAPTKFGFVRCDARGACVLPSIRKSCRNDLHDSQKLTVSPRARREAWQEQSQERRQESLPLAPRLHPHLPQAQAQAAL